MVKAGETAHAWAKVTWPCLGHNFDLYSMAQNQVKAILFAATEISPQTGPIQHIYRDAMYAMQGY